MKKRIILFNKPFGVLSQFTGDPGQRTLSEFDLPRGVYAAGRLDKDSEGLMLLTDDGPEIEELLNPKNAHPRTYLVQVEGKACAAAMAKLQAGVEIKGYKTKKCQAEILIDPPAIWDRNPPIRARKAIPTSWLRVTIFEGKNRQVRRMTAKVGLPTLRLVRESIKDHGLGKLKPGEWLEV